MERSCLVVQEQCQKLFKCAKIMTESGGSSSKPHKMKLVALVILSLSGKRQASETLYEVLLVTNTENEFRRMQK